MTLYYTHKILPIPVVVEGAPPFGMGEIESVKIELPAPPFPPAIAITKAELLVRHTRLIHRPAYAFGITVRITFIADYMTRRKCQERIDLTPRPSHASSRRPIPLIALHSTCATRISALTGVYEDALHAICSHIAAVQKSFR